MKIIYASYLGYITQAIVNNFAPLLFLTFVLEYDLTLDKITLITTINFAVQLLVDLVSVKVVDYIGYRICVVAAHVFAASGLIGLALFPAILPEPYMGIMAAVVLYAIGGGIIEVLISPIVEACPTEKKEAAMSLLHSFYCWGHVSVVLLCTLFFEIFGIENWKIMAVVWAIVPLVNCFYFSVVPIYPIVNEQEKMSLKDLLSQKIFWLLIIIMICAGASEQAMSQWASAFAESALHVSKTIGDLAGPCAFAVFMGMARALYGKYSDRIPLMNMMIGSAVLCIACYLIAVFVGNPLFGLIGCAACGFSVGIMWPGTISISSKTFPKGGTAMFSLLAMAGDLGGSIGPGIVGRITQNAGNNIRIGMGCGLIFPVILLFMLFLLYRKN